MAVVLYSILDESWKIHEILEKRNLYISYKKDDDRQGEWYTEKNEC